MHFETSEIISQSTMVIRYLYCTLYCCPTSVFVKRLKCIELKLHTVNTAGTNCRDDGKTVTRESAQRMA